MKKDKNYKKKNEIKNNNKIKMKEFNLKKKKNEIKNLDKNHM